MVQNVNMGKHRGGTATGPSNRALAFNAFAVVLTAVAWGVLVYYAIRLGPGARAGQLGAWLLMVIATLGAVGCLFLALLLGGRIYELVRGEPRPRGVPGGRRARR